MNSPSERNNFFRSSLMFLSILPLQTFVGNISINFFFYTFNIDIISLIALSVVYKSFPCQWLWIIVWIYIKISLYLSLDKYINHLEYGGRFVFVKVSIRISLETTWLAQISSIANKSQWCMNSFAFHHERINSARPLFICLKLFLHKQYYFLLKLTFFTLDL